MRPSLNALFMLGVIFTSAPMAAQTADIVVVAGKTYEELEFISTNGEVATFYSKQGPFTAKWTELPSSVRKRFANAYTQAFDRETEAAAAALGAPVMITGSVIRKLNQGILLMWNERQIILRGYQTTQALAEGEKISVMARRAGQMEYQDGNGETKLARAFIVK
jgi:hypothetical protein